MIVIKKRKNAAGFTLMDLLIGMILGTILAIILGALLYFNFILWRNNKAQIDIQQDSIVIMETFSRVIRPADISTITIPSPASITIGDTSFYLQGNILYKTVAGNTSAIIMNSQVTGFIPTIGSINGVVPGCVNITINLLNNPAAQTLKFTIGCRT